MVVVGVLRLAAQLPNAYLQSRACLVTISSIIMLAAPVGVCCETLEGSTPPCPLPELPLELVL